MENNIGEVVSQAINNLFIQHYFIKKKDMTYDEAKKQEKNFSKMIGYCILFKEVEGLEEYMAITKENKEIEFLKQRIADKIGIDNQDIENRIEDIISYAFENFIENGYTFHGGNSKAMEDNIKNGLGPSQTSREDQQELLYIASIYEKYGNDKPLGWATLDIKNGRSGWFYDSTPESMLYYANSPEWFGQLCGNNHCYAWGFVPEENRHGYENRDYDTSLLTITKLIEKNKMNEHDRQEIVNFFNKCWDKFGDTDPCLAFVPIRSLKDISIISRWKDYYLPSAEDDNQNRIFSDVIKGGCHFLGKNISCNKEVDPSDLSYVNLSPMLPRMKIDKDAKQKEMTILDCMRKLNDLDMESLFKVQDLLNQLPAANKKRG